MSLLLTAALGIVGSFAGGFISAALFRSADSLSTRQLDHVDYRRADRAVCLLENRQAQNVTPHNFSVGAGFTLAPVLPIAFQSAIRE